jgi:rhodanese-related sulfurtransferase
MNELKRISPEETRQKISSGKALLVCAYEDDAKFAKMHLEGAISMKELRSRISSVSHEQEIIFYCA